MLATIEKVEVSMTLGTFLLQKMCHIGTILVFYIVNKKWSAIFKCFVLCALFVLFVFASQTLVYLCSFSLYLVS